MPDHLNDPEYFVLVKTYQIYTHSRTCGKYNKNECHFSYSKYFTEKTVILKPIDCKFSKAENHGEILRQVKSYIENNLYAP